MNNICEKCPIRSDNFPQGEQLCQAVGGSLEFSIFSKDCRAVMELAEQGIYVTTFSELLKNFPKITNVKPNENNSSPS